MNKSESGKLGAQASRIILSRLKQERMDEYLKSPTKCIVCGFTLKYERRNKGKFCSRSCAAKLNNTLSHKRKRSLPRCRKCEVTHNNKSFYCRSCEIDINIEAGLIHCSLTLKKFLIRRFGKVCSCCYGTVWMGKEIPLELDHKDGNPTNDNINNLRLLCSNCHSQTPTAKGKNKGNGRKSRGMNRP